jgi:hypothetical protein
MLSQIASANHIEETRSEEEIAYDLSVLVEMADDIFYKVVMTKNNAIAITVSIMQIHIHGEDIQVACCGLLDKLFCQIATKFLIWGARTTRPGRCADINRFKRAISSHFSLLDS